MISPNRIPASLEERTKKELLALAREKGLKGYSRLKKAELVQRIRDAFSARSDTVHRIALVAWEGVPGEPGGDAGRHVERLAQAHRAAGADVHLFVRAPEDGDSVTDGLSVHRFRVSTDGEILDRVAELGARIAAAIRAEEELAAPFEVIHAHDWTGAEAVRQLPNRACRYVLTIHSIEAVRCGDWPFEFSPAIEALEQEAARRADEIVVLEEAVAEQVVERYGVDPTKIRIVAEPFPTERFAGELADPGVVKARYGIGPMDPTTLYLGPLDEDHGADVLMEAIPEVLETEPQARFIFVGDGILGAELRRMMEERGIGGAVRLLGHREGPEVEDLVRAADLVVVPSRRPTSEGPVLCAWSAARPVVVTEEGPSRHVLDEETGLRARAEPTGVAGGIRRVFEDWDRARRVARTGQEALLRKHSWAAFAGRMMQLYRS